jgi:hypothetical protein
MRQRGQVASEEECPLVALRAQSVPFAGADLSALRGSRHVYRVVGSV